MVIVFKPKRQSGEEQIQREIQVWWALDVNNLVGALIAFLEKLNLLFAVPQKLDLGGSLALILVVEKNPGSRGIAGNVHITVQTAREQRETHNQRCQILHGTHFPPSSGSASSGLWDNATLRGRSFLKETRLLKNRNFRN